MMKTYRITFKHGQVYEFDGDRMTDDGLSVTIWDGEKIAIRYQDSAVAAVEQIDAPLIESGDVNEFGGYCLYNGDGEMVMSLRKGVT